jgi:sulfur-carrier protein
MKTVTLLYFAKLRETIGIGEERVELPAEVTTANALIDWLSDRSASHARAFAERERVRCALDRVMAPLSASVGTAKEIAFFPPVTGG